ncbi:MAG: hypothetical protein WHW07_09905 [Bacteroidales bacterium]
MSFLTVRTNLKNILPNVLLIGIPPMGACLSSSPKHVSSGRSNRIDL